MTIKEYILSWARRGDNDADVIDRPQAQELSDEYLQRLQHDIDSKLKKGVQFTSVSRASW